MKAQTIIQKRRQADVLVQELLETIRTRQENRGSDHRDATAYTLGYLSSMLTNIIAESPKNMKYVRETMAYVKENA